MIHRSPFPDVVIPDVPLTDFVLGGATDHPGRAALIDGPSGRVTTYGGLDVAVRSLAGGLVASGFAPGDVLALMAPNSPEYAVAFHGTAMAGGIVTTINPTYTAGEVREQLRDAGARLMVTIAPLLEVAREAAEGTAVEGMYLLGEGPAPSLAALSGQPLAAHVPAHPDDVVVLPYSSGTTGLSKGVMLTHRNLVANVVQTLAVADVAPGEVVIAVLPFFHIYGMEVLMNLGLAAGATIVTVPRFDLEQFLALHQEYRVTRSFVAPPIVLAFAKHPVVDRYDLSSLLQVTSGAAPLSAELAMEAAARIGCEVVQGYGLTESSPVTHSTPRGHFRPGSVGPALPNTEVMIVDPQTGEPLGFDSDGEVWIRGPQVMKGYLNKPEATAATIDNDGWLHTGDIGHVDVAGHLYVVDRLKELIKYKGFQVPPAELEAVLLTHPAVADAAVVGRPDEEAGEVPVGFVVLRPGGEASAAGLAGFVEERVAHYKRLREVVIVDAIPKSAAGKILRRVLRDRMGGGG